MQAPSMLATAQWRLDWSSHWASHSVRESGSNRRLEFDGETRRQDVAVGVGLGGGVTARLSIPYLWHGSGWLDQPIDQWHGFWGLPDGPRSDQPQDAFVFRLTGAGGFSLEEERRGLGDMELQLAKGFAERDWGSIEVFVNAKLATGDERDFLGSGDRSLGVGLRIARPTCLSDTVSCHLQFGAVDVGRLPFGLAGDRRALFAGVSVAWQLSDTLALLGQLDGHSALYSGAPVDNNGAPLWASLLLRWQPGDRWRIEAGFNEDAAVGASPDISFIFGASTRF